MCLSNLLAYVYVLYDRWRDVATNLKVVGGEGDVAHTVVGLEGVGDILVMSSLQQMGNIFIIYKN